MALLLINEKKKTAFSWSVVKMNLLSVKRVRVRLLNIDFWIGVYFLGVFKEIEVNKY